MALPVEHGGWSLTIEPALLGLIVAPSWAGLALAGAGLVAFVLRTPLKLAVGDRLRGRKLDRTSLARRVAAGYLAALAALVAAAAATASTAFWSPFVVAAPLFVLELGYDVRSRSRHLIPELAGTIGIGSVGAAIVLAGGGSGAEATGVWVVAAARALAAVPFVRVQLRRAKRLRHTRASSDGAQAAAVTAAAAAMGFGVVPAVAMAGVAGLAAVHLFLLRRPPPRAAVLGAQQVVLGLTLVVLAGLAMAAP